MGEDAGSMPGAGQPPSQDTQDSQNSQDSEDQDENQNAGVLQKSLFPDGVKPGDVVTFRVTAVHESEVLVEPDTESDGGGEPGPGRGPGGPPSDSDMQSMMD